MRKKLDELDRLADFDDTTHRKKLIAMIEETLDHYDKSLEKYRAEGFSSEYIGRIITTLSKVLDNYSYKNVGYYRQFQELIQRAIGILRATTGARYAIADETDYTSFIKLNLHGKFIALMDEFGEVHLHKGNTVFVGKQNCLCGKRAKDDKQVDPSKHEICSNCLEIAFEFLMKMCPNRDKEEKENAISIPPPPKFLILMTDDNQIVKQPLIEIKEGEDVQTRINEVIQDLIADEDVDIDSETACLLKAVEVQFIGNHFIHQHFSVTGF